MPASEIPDGWMGLDVGPDSIKFFSEILDTTLTVIWNGPMGVFEFEKFAAGTDVSSIILSFLFHFQCNSGIIVICWAFPDKVKIYKIKPRNFFTLNACIGQMNHSFILNFHLLKEVMSEAVGPCPSKMKFYKWSCS